MNGTEDWQTPEMALFTMRMRLRSRYVAGGLALLTIGALLVAVASLNVFNLGVASSEAFRFIGLLVIFMAALAASAAVFTGLRMGDAKEAFGLPSGSIRALIAIGVMILFVVFGLPLVTADESKSSSPGTVIQTLAIDPARVPDALRSATDQGLIAIVIDYGAPAAAVGAAPARPAKVELRAKDHFAERLETNRQIITAILTLLTSIIGFYFGSRSVTDAIKPTGGPDPSSTELALQRKEIGTRLDGLKTALLAQDGKVQTAETVPDPANTEEAAERKRLRSSVDALRARIQAQQSDLEKTLTDLDAAIASIASAQAPDVQAVHQQSTRALLGKATDLIAAAEAALPAYSAEVDNYVAASAQG